MPCSYAAKEQDDGEFDVCTVDARVVVDAVPFCRTHAGEVALVVLMEEDDD